MLLMKACQVWWAFLPSLNNYNFYKGVHILSGDLTVCSKHV